MFANLVMKEVFNVDLPSLEDNSIETNVRLANGTVVGSFYNSTDGTLTLERVRTELNKAQVGDVIQMYWNTGAGYGNTQHTVIVSSIYDGQDKIEFLNSNWTGTIKNYAPAYSTFQNCITGAETYGGFTIYRFVGTIEEPPEPTPPTPTVDQPVILSTSFPDARVDEEYKAEVEYSGTLPITFSLSMQPSWLGITITDDNKVYLSGTPTKAGIHVVAIVASNSAGSTVKMYTFKVAAAPVTQAIALDKYTIPDDNFRNYLKGLVSGRSMMTAAEVANIKKVEAVGSKITSLKGIEYFTALEDLRCYNNQITELDLSKNTALKILSCRINKLTKIKLGTNTSLESLNCTNNSTLKELDVSLCPNLKELYFDMATVKVKCANGNIPLDAVHFPDANFRNYVYNMNHSNSLILAASIPNIKKVEAVGSKIASLKGVEYFTALEDLRCYNNQITELDLSKNTALNTILCYNNPLTYLNVDGCPELVTLNCRNTKLESLYLGGCPKLANLYTDDTTRLALNPVKPTGKNAKITFSSDPLASAVLNEPYSAQIYASGVGAISYTPVKASAIPAGLTLSTSGLLSGTPTKSGNFSFAVNATSTYATAKKTLKLSVLVPTGIATASLNDGTIGKSYSATIKADKGVKSPTWSASGLPSGLTINAKTGKISGKPSTTGTFSVTITAATVAGTATKTLSLNIKGLAPKLSGSLAKASINEYYSASLKLTQGSNVTWSITGYPEGLNFDTSTGTLSGIPTEIWSKKITITASNDWGKVSKALTFTVKNNAPAFKTKSLPAGTVGQEYYAFIEVSGSPEITLTASNLPSWLSLEGSVLKGTPDSAGTSKVKITATNAKSVSKTYSLKVTADTTKNKALPESPTQVEPEIVNENAADESIANVNALSVIDCEYEIVAELGTVSVDESGMYDFTVKLSPDVEIGAELMYLAGSSEPSDDDDIADFYDEAGTETAAVPASREVTVSVWLNKGTVYNPALAIRR